MAGGWEILGTRNVLRGSYLALRLSLPGHCSLALVEVTVGVVCCGTGEEFGLEFLLIGTGNQSLPFAVKQLQESLRHLGVELGAGQFCDLLSRPLNRPRLLVRARVRERIEDIRHGHDAPR